jgi:hypothetical protein
MTSETVAQLTADLIALFDPLVQAVEDTDYAEALLKDMGYQAPSGAKFLDDFSPLFSALLQLVDQADDLLRADTEPDYVALFRSLIDAIQDIVKLIRDIGTTLQSNFPADFLTATGMVEQFPRELADYLLVRMIERQYPVMHSSLLLTGIIDQSEVTTAATPFNTPYMKRVIRWEKLGDYVSSPLSSMQQAYGWDTDHFDYDRLVGNIHRFGQSIRLFSSLANPNPETLQALNSGADAVTDDNADKLRIVKFPLLPVLDAQIGAELYPVLNGTKDKTVGLGLGLYFDPSGGLNYSITDALSLGVKYTGTGPLDAGVVILPNQPLQLISNIFGGSGPQADLSTFIPEFTYANADQKTLLFDISLAKLEFSSWGLRAGVLGGVDGVYIETDIKGATFTFGAGQGDGFLQEILPAEPMAADFDLTIGFSSKTGLYFGGGLGLEVKLPSHISIGPIALEGIAVAIKPADGNIPLTFGVDISARIGPLDAVVQNMGAAVILSFPANRDGNLGPLQVDLGFKPPSGLGISVDAALVLGGGFLGHNDDEYSGALDLTVGDYAVKAYGVVQTKLPGGVPGYSFVVALSVEFTPSIELAFGFSLDGIGGLVGINRTVSVDAVETALWGHHLDGLLFPKDPIATAPQLLAALDSYFPAAPGRYLFGPLAKIGWGGEIVQGEVALLLELPEPLRIFLLGEIKVGIPQEEPQLELHISFAGGLDFGKKLAFFDATLHDSRIEAYPISGDLAFRYAWSDDGVFALAVGGFHPHFQPPAAFPTLKRLSITIASSVAQLDARAYFALTANTLQFGARVELTAGTGSFNVHGWLGFDALCERHPLSFAFDLSAGVELRHDSSVLASVHLDGHLSGPNPWHIAGEASLSLLFFDVTVHFDKTWGYTGGALPLPDPLPLLIAALSDRSSFTGILPAGVHSVVSTLTTPPDGGQMVLLDPASNLRIAQRVIPLGQPVTRFGTAPLGRTLQLSMEGLAVFNSSIEQPPTTTEEFAPAQFFEFSDAEKLSLPSFSRFSAGVEIGGEVVDIGSGTRSRTVITPLVYNTTIVDSPTVKRPGALYALDATVLLTMSVSGMTRGRGLDRYAPPVGARSRMDLEPDRWVIAGVDDLKLRDDITGDGSKLGAHLALQRFLADNPEQQGHLQVVLAGEAS